MESDKKMITYNLKNLSVDDDETMHAMMDQKFLEYDKQSKTFTVRTKLLSGKLLQLTQLHSKNKEHQQKIQDLEVQLKELEKKETFRIAQQENLEQSRTKSKRLSSQIKGLQTDLENKNSEISSLRKQVEDLQFVRGISDCYGTYRSLQKTLDMLYYIRDMVSRCGSVRWIEIVKHFKSYRWKETTVEYHLKKLREEGIIIDKRVGIKGEYVIDEEKLGKKCEDFDNLVKCIVGSRIYDLAKESWIKKQ